MKLNLAIWWFVLGLLGYLAVFYTAGYDSTVYTIGALIFGTSLLVVTTWGSTALQAFRRGNDGPALLALAIISFAGAAFYQRVWVVWKRVAGGPEWMETSVFGPVAGLFIFFALSLTLLAVGTQEGNVPRRSWFYWAIGIFLSGALMGGLLAAAIVGGKDVRSELACTLEKPVRVAGYCRGKFNAN